MSFLPEALEMSQYVQERPGNTIAGLDFLDLHPEYRLGLEGLSEGQGGCLYNEVPDFTSGDTLPVHIRNERRFWMRYTKNFVLVQGLLEALKGFYASPGATATAGLKQARTSFLKRLNASEEDQKLPLAVELVQKLIKYYVELANELPVLEDQHGITNLGDREIGAQYVLYQYEYPIAKNYTVLINTRIPDGQEGSIGGSTTRQEIVHVPYGDVKKDWIDRQPMKFQILFYRIQACKNSKALPGVADKLMELGKKNEATGKKSMTSSQLSVLWDKYKAKRDYFRLLHAQRAESNMSPLCKALINKIKAKEQVSHLGYVGACLFNWSKGEKFQGKAMPLPMTQGEWSIVWDVYRTHKVFLKEQEAELKRLKEA